MSGGESLASADLEDLVGLWLRERFLPDFFLPEDDLEVELLLLDFLGLKFKKLNNSFN